jgi:hypothetical protein
VRVIGRQDGPGTSKRKAIVLDDAENKENGRKANGAQVKKKADVRKVPVKTARELEGLRVSRAES